MDISIEKLQFDEKGLIPAIVQDAETGQVLTLAYMNEESLLKTIETNETWFFSRKRQELWNKGATSGNKQEVARISLDCDADALLVQVKPAGPACHTGNTSCFSEPLHESEMPSKDIVERVIERIRDRKDNPVEGTYTSYLFKEGLDKILKKVGEETTEVVIGAKNDDREELTNELSDLLYHVLVLMELKNISVSDIKRELINRNHKKEGSKSE